MTACDSEQDDSANPWAKQGSAIGGADAASPAGNTVSERVAVFPSKIPILKSTKQAEVAVTIDGNATTRKVTEGALCIEGYYKVQLGKSSGLPRSTAVPTFRWVAPPSDGSDTTEDLPRSWPHKEERVALPLDGRSHLVAWVDIDGNGVLSTGDRVSPPIEPLESSPEGTVEFRIDRIFVDPTAPSAPPAPIAQGGEPDDGGEENDEPLPPYQPFAECDSSKPGEGCLIGMVTRAVESDQDGIGTLLLVVFASTPYLEVASKEVARLLVPKLDLSAKQAQYPYIIPGIEKRSEPYSVVAVFDDSADLNTEGLPRLRKGDLVARLGAELSWPTVVVGGDSPVFLDLDLNVLHEEEVPPKDDVPPKQ